MKAMINGVAIEGTPSEVAEYRRLVEEAPVALKPGIAPGQAPQPLGRVGVHPGWGSLGVTAVVGQVFGGSYTLKYTELGAVAVVPSYPPNFAPAYGQWPPIGTLFQVGKIHAIPGGTVTLPPHPQAASPMEELIKSGQVATTKTEGNP
jgi:hypothetical protein